MRNPHEIVANSLKCSLDLPDSEIMDHSLNSEVIWTPTGQLWTQEKGSKEELVLPMRITSITRELAERSIVLINLMAWSDEPNRYHVKGRPPFKDMHNRIQGLQAALALQANVTVMQVGNPGVESKTMLRRLDIAPEKGQINRLTDEQSTALKLGNFGPVSRDVSMAIANALEDRRLSNHEVYIFAPSLAASVAAAGLSRVLADRGVTTKGIVMIDGVGFKSGAPLERVRQFLNSNGPANCYREANHPLHRATDAEADLVHVARRVSESAYANAIYGLCGIPVGKIPENLLDQAGLFAEMATRVQAISAGATEFGQQTIEATRLSMQELSGKGVNAEHLIIPGAGHGSTMCTEPLRWVLAS